MNSSSASNFINSLVRNLQVLCHSNVDFSDNVEVIGHIYLSVDKSTKFNYIVNEKVCKSDGSSTVFVSNSFHADQAKKDNKTPEEPKDVQVKREQIPNTQSESNSGNSYPQNIRTQNRRATSDGNDLSKFNQNFHRQKRPLHQTSRADAPYDYEHKRQKGMTQTNSFSYPSPVKSNTSHTGQSSASSAEIPNIKEEPIDDDLEITFEKIADTSWSQQSTDNQHVDENNQNFSDPNVSNFGGQQFGIYPVGFFDGSSNSLDALTHISEKSGASGHGPDSFVRDLSNQQFQALPPVARQQIEELLMKRKTELSLENKIEIIRASQDTSGPKPSQHALASKFGVTQQAICYILKRKEFFITNYERKYGRKPF